jgi:hypothetical protein
MDGMFSGDKICSGVEAYQRIYTNTINSDNFDEMSKDIEKVLGKYHLNHRKKLFYLFIESVQNVIKHGLNDQINSVFYFLKKKDEQKFLLITGNPIEKDKKQILTHKIDRINRLTKGSIDKLYFRLMDNDYFTEKGGAGLGFFQMRRKSNYKEIGYHIKDYEGWGYLYIILSYHAS